MRRGAARSASFRPSMEPISSSLLTLLRFRRWIFGGRRKLGNFISSLSQCRRQIAGLVAFIPFRVNTRRDLLLGVDNIHPLANIDPKRFFWFPLTMWRNFRFLLVSARQTLHFLVNMELLHPCILCDCSYVTFGVTWSYCWKLHMYSSRTDY